MSVPILILSVFIVEAVETVNADIVTAFSKPKATKKWLPPSLQSRINHTFTWIDKFSALVPNLALHIEVGKFDTAKMINPDITV